MIPTHPYHKSGIFHALICIFFLLRASVVAQPALNISGRVTDAGKDFPLLFAQIVLSNSTTGTVTNEEGQFFLSIPADRIHDSIVISYLGYEPARMAVSGMTGQTTLVRLKPREFNLKEVEVLALTPEEVMRRMFNRISENYGRDSVLLTAFYRSRKYTGQKLAEYAEAIIEDLKTGYFTQNTMKDVQYLGAHSNLTHLIKGRVVSDTNLVNSMGDAGKMAGCLGCTFREDIIECNFRTMFDEEDFRFYTYTMEELSNPEGGKIYHIRFDQANNKIKGRKGEMFIDGNSFALMTIRLKPSYLGFEKFTKDKIKRTYTIQNVPGWIVDMPLFDQTMIYSKRNNSWYLSTIHDEQWITFTLPSTGRKIRMGYKNDLVVTDVSRDPEKLHNFKGDAKAGIKLRWDQLVGQADEAFWANFNYLPVEESLKKAIGEIKK